MALNIVNNISADLTVIKSAKIYNLDKFRKSFRKIKTCPVCGKKFTVDIHLKDLNPEKYKYCSKFCASKASFSALGKFSDKEALKFIDSKKNLIELTLRRMIFDDSRDKNLSPKDMRQEMRIALFYLYSRAKRAGINPYTYSKNYLITLLKSSLRLDQTEFKRFNNLIEQAVFDEKDEEYFSSHFTTSYDIDKKLDIEDILYKIYKLSLEHKSVKVALLHAFLYGAKTNSNDKEAGKIFNDICCKQMGLCKATLWKDVRKGTEHIFYNDYKNIMQYIHINNLEGKYRFNQKEEELLTEDEFGKEIAQLLEEYSGYATCKICGKRFKRVCKHQAYCSNECKKIGLRKIDEECRKRQGGIVGAVTRKCAVCGKTFETTNGKVKHAKRAYCSDECRYKAYKIYYNEHKGKKAKRKNK